MFIEDNSGFVLFPHPKNKIVVGKNIGKTLVYLISFEPKRNDGELSNVTLNMPGLFCSDDVVNRPEVDYNSSIDNLVSNQVMNDNYDMNYFPNINSEDELKKVKSINLLSCVCIGWDNKTYEFARENKFWTATFRDLTNEGQRLYYSIKKLHNNKEVRILTFNHI
jgi:hypothetical protein